MMTPDQQAKLRRSLVLHEKYEKFPYVDSVGKTTIGIGYNLTDRGISDDWIIKQYNEDVTYHYSNLFETFPWFKDLSNDRQIILIDMCFMGFKRFLTFKKMLSCLAAKDYQGAAREMMDSKWAEQVKDRAATLANAMLTGEYDV